MAPLGPLREHRLLVVFNFAEQLEFAGRAITLAKFSPDGGPGQCLGLFEQGETRGVVAGELGLTERLTWLQEGEQERLLRGARADRPGGDAVDRCIKEIEADVGARKRIAADEFLHDGLRLIVEEHDVVAVPTHATGDVQEQLGHIHEHGGNFIGDALGRVEVAGVEAESGLVLLRVAHIELVRTDDEALGPDAKELTLDSIDIVSGIESFGEDGVKAIRKALAEALAVGRQILHTVGNPYISHSGAAELLAHLGGDHAAALTVLDPKIARAGIRAAQSETIVCFRVRKVGRVEIHADTLTLTPVDPALEVFRLNRIAVDFLSAEIAVDGVEVEAVVAREKTEHLLKVLTQLIDAARFAGVVTRHGKTATERARAFFESDDIIALPAVQRDWSLGQDGESLFDITPIEAYICLASLYMSAREVAY